MTRIEKQEHELRLHFNDIDVTSWINLPIELKYPAPKHINNQKIKSGLSWVDFENQSKKSLAS